MTAATRLRDYPDDFPVFPGCSFTWEDHVLARGDPALLGKYEASAKYREVRDFYVAELKAGYEPVRVNRHGGLTFFEIKDGEGRWGRGNLFVQAPSFRRRTTSVIVYLGLPPGVVILLLNDPWPGPLRPLQLALELVTLPYYLVRSLIAVRRETRL